jgi:hypothetical protein
MNIKGTIDGAKQFFSALPWNKLAWVVLIIVLAKLALAPYQKEISRFAKRVTEIGLGGDGVSIKATGPTVNISISAQELASISTLSAYQVNVRDRLEVIEGLRGNLNPGRLINKKIKPDLELCKQQESEINNEIFRLKNKKATDGEVQSKVETMLKLKICEDSPRKELEDFEKWIDARTPKLAKLASEESEARTQLAAELDQELRRDENKFRQVSYYYLVRAAITSMLSPREIDVLPHLYAGLGKLPRESGLHYAVAYYLTFTGKHGSIQAAIYHFEQALGEIKEQKAILTSTLKLTSGCPFARYEMSEAVLSNAVAWFMALQGQTTDREAAMIHVRHAIDLKNKIYQNYNSVKECVPPPSKDRDLAYEDTKGYVAFRFGESHEAFEEAEEILDAAADEAHANGLWDLELTLRQHASEATSRKKFFALLENLGSANQSANK